jgi:hypothetical protein
VLYSDAVANLAPDALTAHALRVLTRRYTLLLTYYTCTLGQHDSWGSLGVLIVFMFQQYNTWTCRNVASRIPVFGDEVAEVSHLMLSTLDAHGENMSGVANNGV